MQTSSPRSLNNLCIGYLAGYLAGCVVAILCQVVLVLTRVSPAKSLAWKTTSQTCFAVACIFFVSLLLEIFAPNVGLKRWQSLALILVVSVFVVTLGNLGTRPVLLHLVFGTSIFVVFAMSLFFCSRYVGEKVIAHLDSRGTDSSA